MESKDCLFCDSGQMEPRTVFETNHFFVILDNFPVTMGHALIISKRHVPDIFELNLAEQMDFWEALDKTKEYLEEEYYPDGYNGGFNAGEVAGQTVFHFHYHIFSRYKNDVENPRGGIRNFKKSLVAYD